MRTLKYLIVTIIGVFSFSQSHCQDQIRLKFGAAKSFKSGKNTGLHMTAGYNSPLPSGIGLEYFRPLPEKKMGLLAGAFVELQGFSGGVNPSKFPVSTYGRFFASTYGSVKLYAGVERTLSKKTSPSSNKLSLVAGAALGINVLGTQGKLGSPSLEEAGVTLNGDIYGGSYVNEPDGWAPGYYSIISSKTANTITPELFAGLRWNINNKQGKTVLILEGIVNYSLLPKMNIEFPYTLNGQPKLDKIKDHGFNVQLNLLVPIKTFTKGKR